MCYLYFTISISGNLYSPTFWGRYLKFDFNWFILLLVTLRENVLFTLIQCTFRCWSSKRWDDAIKACLIGPFMYQIWNYSWHRRHFYQTFSLLLLMMLDMISNTLILVLKYICMEDFQFCAILASWPLLKQIIWALILLSNNVMKCVLW